MSQSLKDAVIGTLTSERLSRVNFQFGSLRVYPQGYASVAEAIRNGSIELTAVSGNANYAPDTPPGQVHTFAVPESIVRREGGELRVEVLSATDRGTLVHEATHALQDYQRVGAIDPGLAEGAAYVAGWIAAIQWGQPPLPPSSSPRQTSHMFARYLAGKLLAGELVYVVPDADVRTLARLVLTGASSRYVFNGI